MSVVTGGGATTVDPTRVYRGAFALQSSMPAITGAAAVAAQVLQGQAWPTHTFARVFAYLPSPLSPDGADVLNYVNGVTELGVVLYVRNDDPVVFLSTFGGPNPRTAMSATSVPLGEWICFETEIDGVAQVVNVWMNGNALSDLSEPVALGNWTELSVGLTSAAGSTESGPYEAWFDELAIDTSRIGCDR